MKRPSDPGGPFCLCGSTKSYATTSRTLGIESMAAETPKFTASLLLVHGLWCTAAVWRRFMGYLAHRGWVCHAMNLRGHGASMGAGTVAQAGIADYFEDVRQVIAACETPPIVIGHDLGGLLALCCSDADVLAGVALAPLVPRALSGTRNRALRTFDARLSMRRMRPLAPPRGRMVGAYFGDHPPSVLVPDSAQVARELLVRDLSICGVRTHPALVLVGDRDRISPPQDAQQLATGSGANCRVVPGVGHAMPWERGWEQRVAEIHRWLFHVIGEPLLLPPSRTTPEGNVAGADRRLVDQLANTIGDRILSSNHAERSARLSAVISCPMSNSR